MGTYKEVDGDLLALARKGQFDVIAHGCNCFCTMGAGIAPQMAKWFGCDEYALEASNHKGNINKLGQISYGSFYTKNGRVRAYAANKTNRAWEEDGWKKNIAINCYTQYGFGKNHSDGSEYPLNYNALALVLQKINHTFRGQHIGLPQIGCGLAGGDWEVVREMIKFYLTDCDITVVNYKP